MMDCTLPDQMRQSLVVLMMRLLPFTIVVLPLGTGSFSTLPSTAIPGRRYCAVRAGTPSSQQQESQRGQRHHRRCRSLFGIKEWRAEMQQRDLHQNSPHSVWLLPFQASDVLLIGEKRTIVLNDGRFFDLFQDVLDQEHSIMGMALMGDDFLLPTIVLCEISDYQIDTGFRGRIHPGDAPIGRPGRDDATPPDEARHESYLQRAIGRRRRQRQRRVIIIGSSSSSATASIGGTRSSRQEARNGNRRTGIIIAVGRNDDDDSAIRFIGGAELDCTGAGSTAMRSQ
jgi:hypothetical protein